MFDPGTRAPLTAALHPIAPAAPAGSPVLHPPGRESLPIRIGIACTPGELAAIYRFRYKVYVDEMHRKQAYADHSRREIIDPLDSAAINIATWSEGRVIGVVRLNFARRTALGSYEDFYDMGAFGSSHPTHTSICTRFMVDPELRGSAIALRLVRFAYNHALRHDIRWNVIDCNDHLIGLFERLGYRQHVAPRVHPDYGRVNVMRLDLVDAGHLRSVGSPYEADLARHIAHTTFHGKG